MLANGEVFIKFSAAERRKGVHLVIGGERRCRGSGGFSRIWKALGESFFGRMIVNAVSRQLSGFLSEWRLPDDDD
jgi:hypothetical protein